MWNIDCLSGKEFCGAKKVVGWMICVVVRRGEGKDRF